MLNSQGEPLIDPNVLSSRNFETPNGECWAGVVEGTSEAVCVQSSALITVDYRRFADFFCNEPVSLSERAVVALERTDTPGGYLLPHVDLYRRGQPYDGPVYARDEQGLCVERSVPTQAFRLTPTSDLTGLTRFDVEGL